MTLPRHLLFVRHGESEANKLLNEIKDTIGTESKDWELVPDFTFRLTETGINQARQTGKYLKNLKINIDKFFVSPYKRAKETAAHLSLEYAYWETIRELRERSWGEISVIPNEVYQKHYERNFRFYHADPLYWVPVAGESIVNVAEGRLGDFFSRLHRSDPNNTVLCVSHNDLMVSARLVLEYITDDDFVHNIDLYSHIPNGGILHYSRIDPVTNKEHKRIKFVQLSYPKANGDMHIEPWKTIEQPRYNNQELLNSL